jgi:tRNA pseudouridine13 synthase
VRLLTESLPGTGGLLKAVPEDFVVDELPAYPASGEGTHTFLRIEKRALTTDEAVRRVCSALSASERDAGTAGQKDRQAVTRQWISVPGVDPERALALTLDGVRVIEAVRHGHKLRTGHLSGNRFEITLRGTSGGPERARAVLEALAVRGMANYFGAQRFGVRGDNAQQGRKLLDGEAGGASRGQRRMLISAYQADLFNRYLDARLDDRLLDRALAGDVLKKSDTGGLFTVEDVAEAQARLDRGALVVTGPMFGHKMMSPPEGTESHAREAALLAQEAIDAARFARLGKLAEGTRRPLRAPLAAPEVHAGPEPDSLVVRFSLPPGSYATVVLAEITKN